MLDHFPQTQPLVGGAWGVRFDQQEPDFRYNWTRSWEKMLNDKLTFADRGDKGPDQTILSKHVWPWAKFMSLQHDSYT